MRHDLVSFESALKLSTIKLLNTVKLYSIRGALISLCFDSSFWFHWLSSSQTSWPQSHMKEALLILSIVTTWGCFGKTSKNSQLILLNIYITLCHVCDLTSCHIKAKGSHWSSDSLCNTRQHTLFLVMHCYLPHTHTHTHTDTQPDKSQCTTMQHDNNNIV